jgi:radical SAM superfamily enzyme YgiQ (UPF0313 family)
MHAPADPLDCLIVHCPKFQNRYPSLGNYTSLQLMALGIFALADHVNRAGFRTRILHLGVEKARDPGFTLAGYLRRHPARVVAFSLQFHQQLYDSLRAARAVKDHDPSIFVVAGGMTAGFFAADILRDFPAVDAVIKGDGEMPLAALLEVLVRGGRDLGRVPNLWWRREDRSVENEERYVAAQEDLDALDFTNLELLEHYRDYVRLPKIFTRLALPTALRWKLSKTLSQRKRLTFFALPVGRGCVTNCAYCGGGVQAQRLINARTRPIFRSPEKVVETIRRLKGYGYHGAYVSFDPLPLSDVYYRDLFARVRSAGIEFDLTFASWSLPSREFLLEFKKTFTPDSSIYLSPEAGSEEVRRATRGMSFTNAALLETLQFAEESGVKTVVFFSLGIPGESRAQFEETLALKREIDQRFRLAQTSGFSVEIEPAAPWYLYPEKYGITLVRRGLKDFLAEQASPGYSSMSSMGYYPAEYLGEKVSGLDDFVRRVAAVKCRHFCDQRALCTGARCFWGATDLLRLSPSGDVRL